VVDQRQVPRQEVGRRRPDRSSCARPSSRFRVGRNRLGQSERRVPLGHVRTGRRLERRAAEFERRQDPFAEELGVGLAAHLLDHAAENEEPGVAVRVSRTRLEIERTRGVRGDDSVRRLRLLHLSVDEIERIVVAISREVSAKVEERDVLRAREARIVLRDGVAQRQPVLVGQHQEQRACELLRHRADGEHRAGRHGVVGRTIPHAVSLCEDDAAVAHDADGEPDDPFLSDGSTHDAVDLRRRDLLRSHRPREHGRERDDDSRAHRGPSRDSPRGDARHQRRDFRNRPSQIRITAPTTASRIDPMKPLE
jgi:hypothetical protein